MNKYTVYLNTKMQMTTNGNAAGLRRICKRSDQPKIERQGNNGEQFFSVRSLLSRQRHDVPLDFPTVLCHAFWI